MIIFIKYIEDDNILLGNISGLKENGTAARLGIFFEVGDISRVTFHPSPKQRGHRNETEPEQSPTEPDRKRLKRGK